MSVAIISANFGHYHDPSPLPTQRGLTDAILVTDDVAPCDGWRNVVAPSTRPPRMAAKIVKCMPETYTNSTIVIWIDAQLAIVSDLFAEFCCDSLGNGDIALMRHPWRSSLRDEALAGYADSRERFVGQHVRGQARQYIAEGHPDDWGLYWTMIVVRRMTNVVKAFGAAWLEEQRRWSTFDQLSFPYVCRKLLGRPREFAYPIELVRLNGYPLDDIPADGVGSDQEEKPDELSS